MKRVSHNRYDADGSPLEALHNIEVTFDHVLSEETKRAINWHPEQNIHLAVMRLACKYEELREKK